MSNTTSAADPFGTRDTIQTARGPVGIYRLSRLEDQGVGAVSRLPFSMRILLEAVVRGCDGYVIRDEDIRHLANWSAAGPANIEIPFSPARVVLQDFTGVPAVVDLAAMRTAMKRLGGDPQRINPLIPVDLVIDHSIQVDRFGSPDALQANVDLEFERNRERYEFLRWGQRAFANFRVVPPGVGIVHQVNLEMLAKCVFLRKDDRGVVAVPDSLVGTDSHTTMINGLGVVGWGVGGIEAEAVMLGQPIYMLLPDVVGFELTGQLATGVTATDAVLTITQILRRTGVVGKFVEFHGSGVDTMSLADRATIANMAPEYGATMGFFPVDNETLNYLRRTGRSRDEVELVDRYMKEQGLFRTAGTPTPVYTTTMTLDLGSIEPSLAGPKRPQDRVALSSMKKSFAAALKAPLAERGFAIRESEMPAQATVRVPRRRCKFPDRSRRRGHRGDYQLHEYQQPIGDAGGRVAGEEGGRQGAACAATRQDQSRPRIASGHRLPGQGGSHSGARTTRLPHGRLRLHHVHRKQRTLARPGRAGGHARQPGGGSRAQWQSQFRRTRQSVGEGQLPGQPAAGGCLCAGRNRRQGSGHRTAGMRLRRTGRVSPRYLAVGR